MLKVIGDQIIIICAFILAFMLRVEIGHFPNESPVQFLTGYIWMLICSCVFYLFLFWILGYYEKKTTRAVLEELLGVFGVVTMGAVVLLTAVYLRKDLWVSRGIIFVFWILATLGISIFHIFTNREKNGGKRSVKALGALDKEIPLVKRDLKLGVVIVNKDSLSELTELLASIKKAQLKCAAQILVVDNDSKDGSREYLGGQTGVKFIANSENVGYSRAVNQGLKALSECDYYFILNPDIIVPHGAVEAALNFMESDKKIGLAGCKLINPDGTLQYSARTFYSLRTILYRFTPLRGLLSGSALEKEYLMMDWNHNDSREVDWVLGGCMLVRDRAVREVGMMDEKLFMYFDDVDWCYRMWDRGWKVYYLADSVMIHKHIRKSVNDLLSPETRAHIKSLFYFLWKYKYRLIPPKRTSTPDII
jgi:hypothetical protein